MKHWPFAGKRELTEQTRIGLVAREGQATLDATCADGYRGRLHVSKTSSSVRLEHAKSREADRSKASVRAELSDAGSALAVSDESGRPRAILGSTVGIDEKPGAKTVASPSNLSLYDKKGHVLERLPRK